MSEINFTVRKMTKEDVPQALDICEETGVQKGTQCLYTWLTVDPESFHVAVTDEGVYGPYCGIKNNCKMQLWKSDELSTGDVIGACSACVHHEDLAFVGLYCVRKKYRGIGAGIKIWNACMEHVGSRNVCLNAVPDKLELYRDKGGFPIVETDWVCVVNKTSSAVRSENLSDTSPAGVDIERFEDTHLPLIYEYDRKLIGYNREKIIELSCREQDSRTFVAVKDDSCVGFGVIKMSCQETALVGPLYADEKETAEVILKRLILSLPQAKGFAMMTVSNNDNANELIKKIECPTTEECPRLYRKQKVDVDLSKVYGQFDLSFSPY